MWVGLSAAHVLHQQQAVARGRMLRRPDLRSPSIDGEAVVVGRCWREAVLVGVPQGAYVRAAPRRDREALWAWVWRPLQAGGDYQRTARHIVAAMPVRAGELRRHVHRSRSVRVTAAVAPLTE
eukprot:2781514-Prymnesium_polylepis.1